MDLRREGNKKSADFVIKRIKSAEISSEMSIFAPSP